MSDHGFAPRQELDFLPAQAVWATSLISVIIVVVAIAVANGLLHAFGRGAPEARHEAPPREAPAQIGLIEETLFANTRRGIDARDRDEGELQRFGWVDRQHGIAQIPIDRAIDLVARDGGK
jgi:hypothetical protein